MKTPNKPVSFASRMALLPINFLVSGGIRTILSLFATVAYLWIVSLNTGTLFRASIHGWETPWLFLYAFLFLLGLSFFYFFEEVFPKILFSAYVGTFGRNAKYDELVERYRKDDEGALFTFAVALVYVAFSLFLLLHVAPMSDAVKDLNVKYENGVVSGKKDSVLNRKFATETHEFDVAYKLSFSKKVDIDDREKVLPIARNVRYVHELAQYFPAKEIETELIKAFENKSGQPKSVKLGTDGWIAEIVNVKVTKLPPSEKFE